MKNNRITTLVISLLISCLCLSCVGIENGDNGSRGSGNICIRINSTPVQTKASATVGTSYITLYNEDGTENKDFVLECVTVPTGEESGDVDTKAALYGSGRRQGSSGWEGGRYQYYEYKSPIVLTGNCYNNKEKKNTNVYYQEHVAYNEDRELWIPGDGRIWMDDEWYEFRAHLPETLNGVENMISFDSSLQFDYIIPESSSDQQDIMFGYFPFGDRTRQKYGYKVADIPFRHALASVRFMVYQTETGSTGKYSLGVKKVSLVNVYQKGRCTQDGGEAFQWKALTDDGYDAEENGEDAATTTIYGESDEAFELTPGQYVDLGNDEEDGNDYVFAVMPQVLKDHPVELVLNCVSDDGSLTFRATIAGGEWKAGYTTIYRLMPNVVCGTVDLGLSVIWGDKNLGAFKHLETGFFFRWGETSLYDANKKYKYSDNYGNMTRYNDSDGLKVLQPEDDPATHYFGDPWRTPTIEESMELDNTGWIDKYACSYMYLNNMFVSKFDAPYRDRKIAYPSSDANARDIMTSSLANDAKYYQYLYGWITDKQEPGYTIETWDGCSITYTYRGTISAGQFERVKFPLPVRPVIPVLRFNDLVTAGVRPDNIITASAGSSISFTLAEEYEAQTWTAEADGSEFVSGTGSGSITIPSGASKVVIKRDTGVVIGTINVK